MVSIPEVALKFYEDGDEVMVEGYSLNDDGTVTRTPLGAWREVVISTSNSDEQIVSCP